MESQGPLGMGSILLLRVPGIFAQQKKLTPGVFILSTALRFPFLPFFLILLSFFSLKDTKKERLTELSSAGSFPTCPEQPGQSQELGIRSRNSIRIPHVRREHQGLEPSLLPPKVQVSRKLQKGAELGAGYKAQPGWPRRRQRGG